MGSDPNALHPVVTGRCYCGQTSITATRAPRVVAYCHCEDCRRWTGGPVGTFAAFNEDDLQLVSDCVASFSGVPGVRRETCRTCGSALTARFDYLEGQVYVPVSVLDQAEDYPPQLHCHEDRRLSWLRIDDRLERHSGSGRATSGRATLNASD